MKKLLIVGLSLFITNTGLASPRVVKNTLSQRGERLTTVFEDGTTIISLRVPGTNRYEQTAIKHTTPDVPDLMPANVYGRAVLQGIATTQEDEPTPPRTTSRPSLIPPNTYESTPRFATESKEQAAVSTPQPSPRHIHYNPESRY